MTTHRKGKGKVPERIFVPYWDTKNMLGDAWHTRWGARKDAGTSKGGVVHEYQLIHPQKKKGGKGGK